MKFRFKSEDFIEVMDAIRNSPKVTFVWQEIVYIAARANKLLEAHEKTLREVWLIEKELKTAHLVTPVDATSKALLWNVEEIEE